MYDRGRLIRGINAGSFVTLIASLEINNFIKPWIMWCIHRLLLNNLLDDWKRLISPRSTLSTCGRFAPDYCWK